MPRLSLAKIVSANKADILVHSAVCFKTDLVTAVFSTKISVKQKTNLGQKVFK